jgi:hypothetical protein
MSHPVCIVRVDLAAQVAKTGYRLKAVVNSRGIVVGPMSLQHTELRAPGVAFLGDTTGDAVAAVIYNGRIEFRAHPAVDGDAASDSLHRVLAAHPALAPLRGFEIVYGGKKLGRLGEGRR